MKVRNKIISTLAIIISVSCGVGPDEQNGTFLLDESTTLDLVQAIGQITALAGRHASLPNGLDFASSGNSCPGLDPNGKVTISIGQCTREERLNCRLDEQYRCKLVNGAISGTVEQDSEMAKVSLATTNYVEGTVTDPAVGIALHYRGDITVTTDDTNSHIAYDLVLDLYSLRKDGTTSNTHLKVNGGLKAAADDTSIIFDGTVTITTAAGDIIMQPTDWKFARDGSCLGPTSGLLIIDFASAEKSQVATKACKSHKIQHFSIYNDEFVIDEEGTDPSEWELAFLLSNSSFPTFASAPNNIKPALNEFFDGFGSRYWCSLIASPSDSIIATWSPRSISEPIALLAECTVFVQVASKTNPPYVAGLLAFTQPLGDTGTSDLDTVKVLDAYFGGTTIAADSFQLSPALQGDAAKIDTMAQLNAAVACATGFCSAQDTFDTSPWSSAPKATQSFSFELNHLGAWFASTSAGAQFFAIFGL